MKKAISFFIGVLLINKVLAVDLIEIFSFTCIHCYNIENQVQEVAKLKTVNYIPVPLYDQTDIDQVAMINAYFAANSIGKGWDFRNAYFSATFTQGYQAYTASTLIYVLNSIGLNNSQFYQLAASKKIVNNVQNAIMLAVKYKATGTPTFVVNGQYYEGENALQQIFNTSY